MAHNSIIHSFVARDSVVLVGQAPASVPRHVTEIAAGCLQKLSEAKLEEKKLIFAAEGYTFLFLLEDIYIYSVVVHSQDANSRMKQEKFFIFLTQLMDEFSGRYGADVAGVARRTREYGLEEDFGPQLRKLISVFHGESPNEDEKVAKIGAQVQQVKSVMMSNIDRIVDRGDSCNLIIEETKDHRDLADKYQYHAAQFRKKLHWRNHITTMVVIAIIIVLILIIFFWACHGVKCTLSK